MPPINEIATLLLKKIFIAYPELEECVDKEDNLFPEEVFIAQGANILHYTVCLQRIIFNNHLVDEDSTKLAWQLRQCYRIVNAALSSEHPSLVLLQDTLKTSQVSIELLLRPFLDNIDNGMIDADIICCGHAGWYDEEGYITFSSPKSSIVLYNGFGSKISNDLSTDIENNQYNENDVIIKNLETKEETDAKGFIREFSKDTLEPFPNYGIQGNSNLKFRLIEDKTGRILKEDSSRKVFFLDNILKEFPNRRFHFASCLSQYHKKRHNRIGPYAKFKWKKKKGAHHGKKEDENISYDFNDITAANDLLFFQSSHAPSLFPPADKTAPSDQNSKKNHNTLHNPGI